MTVIDDRTGDATAPVAEANKIHTEMGTKMNGPATPLGNGSAAPQIFPRLVAERLIDDATPSNSYLSQWWRLGVGFVVNVNRFTRPNVFVNVDDLDVFWPLLEIGFLEHVSALGLAVETPHGVGHNCFKMPAVHVDRFLLTLRDFFADNAPAIRKQAKERPSGRPEVKNWRKSWWYKVGGVDPFAPPLSEQSPQG